MFDELRGVAADDGERLDVFRDHSASGDNSTLADGDAWQYDRPCANPDAVADGYRRGNKRTVRLRDVMTRGANERLPRYRNFLSSSSDKNILECRSDLLSRILLVAFNVLEIDINRTA